jgi:hypothetical protein
MNPKLQIFDALALMLAEKVPEIKTFRLYNNQFVKEGVEKAFAFPALFLEFSALEYSSKGESLQVGEAVVRFHLGFVSLKTEDRAVFELESKLYFHLQGFNVAGVSTPLDRKREVQDVDHGALNVWQIEYSTLIADNTANRKNKMNLLVGIPSLEVNKEVESYFLKHS